MATMFAQNGQPQGAVQFPPAQHAQPGQMMPTGQQTQGPTPQITFGIDNLPAAPQQQQTFPQQGQQNFGLQFPQQTGGLQPQAQQPPGWQQPAGWQQPQQGVPQQGWQQGQGQNQPQPQQQANGLNLQTRLQGPGIPVELQGRTVGEALGIYSALATEWAGRQSRTPAQQSLQQMQPQQGQPQQPGPQQVPWQSRTGNGWVQQGQGQGSGQPSNLWTNPEETIGQIVEQKIGPLLAPVVQHTQQQGITQAYSIANQSLTDFRALEPEVMQMLAGADPQTLLNPQTWIGAADIIRGRQMREGRYQPPPQQQNQQQTQIPGRGNGNPALLNNTPAGQQSMQMPVYGFFTEQPSTPPTSQFGAGQANGQDLAYAQKFGMPVEQYMAWKYGVQQVGSQPQQQNWR